MGGTKILAAVINSKDGIIARAKIATKSDSSEKAYIESLAAITHEAISISGLKESKIKAVCLGIPGSVNPYTGRIGLAPNLGLKNFYIKEKLQKKGLAITELGLQIKAEIEKLREQVQNVE